MKEKQLFGFRQLKFNGMPIISYDILEGDEIIITRNAVLMHSKKLREFLDLIEQDKFVNNKKKE